MGNFSDLGDIDIKGADIAIVVSKFNEQITNALLDGALNELDNHGISRDKVSISTVPGALELAVVARAYALKGVDAVICLGAVIRGETMHFEYVSNTSALSIAEVATSTGVPCIFGVLTVENESQAQDRIGGSHGHAGKQAAASALQTISTLREITDSKKSAGFLG